ncbi:MAG: hypothetical protein AABZ12_02140 [Planctomycetota bacterium]
MNTTTTNCNTGYDSHCTIPTTIPFENINTPGCYICNWSGHLLRVPDDGVAPGRSPLLTIVGCEPLFVTKISDNPFIPITKARTIASNIDCNVNF